MLAGIITDYAFNIGYMLLAGVAYLIRDWRKLQLAISAPGFLLFFYIWWEHVTFYSYLWLMVMILAIYPTLLYAKGGSSVGQMVADQGQEGGSYSAPAEGCTCQRPGLASYFTGASWD